MSVNRNRRHFSDSIRYQAGISETGSWSNEGSGRGLVRSQLALEYKLHTIYQQLLTQYKEGRNWAAVGQVAHNLLTNSRRIAELKDQLSSGVEVPLLGPIKELEAEHTRGPSPNGEAGVATGDILDDFRARSESDDKEEDSAFSEKSEPEMSVESSSEVDPTPLLTTGVTIKVEVSEVVDPDSGDTSFLVDTHVVSSSGDVSSTQQTSLLHQWKEFEQLGESLAAGAGVDVPELTVSEGQTKPQKLSEFLNRVVRDPALCGRPSLAEFLGIEVSTSVCYFGEKDSQSAKGVALEDEQNPSKDEPPAVPPLSPPPKDSPPPPPAPTSDERKSNQQENEAVSCDDVSGEALPTDRENALKEETLHVNNEPEKTGSGDLLASPLVGSGLNEEPVGGSGEQQESSEVSRSPRPVSEVEVWDMLNSFGESSSEVPPVAGDQDKPEEVGSVAADKLCNGGESASEGDTSPPPDGQMNLSKLEPPSEGGLTMSSSPPGEGDTSPPLDGLEAPIEGNPPRQLPTAKSASDGSELPPKGIPRSGSDPVVDTGGASLSYSPHSDAIHMSLMPGMAPSKTVSSDNLTENGDIFEEKPMKRQASVPSQLSQRVNKTVSKAQVYKRATALMRTFSTKRSKANSIQQGDQGTVELLKAIPTQEWDPTCLLEELYDDYRRLMNNPSGEIARYFGYLEKLPVNQTKATPFKGFKRRYFRAVDGNLYYYESRTAEKPLGLIRLLGAKVVMNVQKLELTVIEKGGTLLVVKAPNAAELNECHRSLQLESAHPTLSTPLSPSSVSTGDNPVLIIDIGASSVRAGFAAEDPYPQVYFPAVCSMDASTLDPINCGLDAFLPQNRYGAKMIYPRRSGLRMDRPEQQSLRLQATYSIISYVFDKLNAEPQYCQVLLTMPPNTDEDQNNLAEMLLAHVGCAAVSFHEQALLALYSYSTTSGIVVDIGDHVYILPVIDGYIIEAGVTRLPFGGNAITDYFSKLITAKGIRYFSETEVYINRYLKENLCYVTENFDEDAALCETNPKAYIRAADVDRFQLPNHNGLRKSFSSTALSSKLLNASLIHTCGAKTSLESTIWCGSPFNSVPLISEKSCSGRSISAEQQPSFQASKRGYTRSSWPLHPLELSLRSIAVTSSSTQRSSVVLCSRV